MTDYSLPPNSNSTLTLNDGDTLTIATVGAITVTGADAVILDLTGTSGGDGKAGKGTGEKFSFAKIKDFTIGEDQVLLDSKVFKELDAGPLSADAFANGKKAKSDDVHILYQNGDIRYDKDGKGGAEAVLFAKVDSGLAITADDFLVI
jgi:hypothetical protein